MRKTTPEIIPDLKLPTSDHIEKCDLTLYFKTGRRSLSAAHFTQAITCDDPLSRK